MLVWLALCTGYHNSLVLIFCTCLTPRRLSDLLTGDREHSLCFCYPQASCAPAFACRVRADLCKSTFFSSSCFTPIVTENGPHRCTVLSGPWAVAFDSQTFKATSRLRQWRQAKKQKMFFAQKYFFQDRFFQNRFAPRSVMPRPVEDKSV